MKLFLNTLKILFITIAIIALGAYAVLSWLMKFPNPVTSSLVNTKQYTRTEIGLDYYKVDESWLRKNKWGIWEMYLEGDAYERGVVYGVLSKELMEKQEIAFIDQIKDMIPNAFFLKSLKYFIAWFNRDIYKYIPEEQLQEIYGISESFSEKYNFIGAPYFRLLNYHAAHDIGHALMDLNIVGCTSFAVQGPYSQDSTLLIGRNFDFNMGEKFSEDKLLVFLNPEQGYKMAFYTWAGFMGVVSGMNEKGLTVTLNAATSELPLKAKQPISLLAREILQYCATIDEAYALASKREIFVSESLLIGSAIDNSSAIIEKSPAKLGIFRMESEKLVCTNHYQSAVFKDDTLNKENILKSDSQYRYDRVEELLQKYSPLDVVAAVRLLRDEKGHAGTFLGYGNPKAINQLLAHHSIVFKPRQKQFWVSTRDYQMGDFIYYDFDTVFQLANNLKEITSDNNRIFPDSSFTEERRIKMQYFRKMSHAIQSSLLAGRSIDLSAHEIETFVHSNPESYLTYTLLGDYYSEKQRWQEANNSYAKALTKEVASKKEIEAITGKMTSTLSITTNR